MRDKGHLLIVLALLLQSGCASFAPHSTEAAADGSASSVAERDLEALRSRLALRAREVAELRLQLLEKQAEINQSIAAHEAAMEQVVRANERLRDRDTRADTVSRIAAANLEIDGARGRVGEEHQSTLEHAEGLLASSRKELAKENFSGASFLADQAANLVRPLGVLPESLSEVALDQEIRFAAPLAMQTIKRSNVRERPGRRAKVLFRLERHQRVDAHAYKGHWVRVDSGANREGWIYYNLLELATP